MCSYFGAEVTPKPWCPFKRLAAGEGFRLRCRLELYRGLAAIRRLIGVLGSRERCDPYIGRPEDDTADGRERVGTALLDGRGNGRAAEEDGPAMLATNALWLLMGEAGTLKEDVYGDGAHDFWGDPSGEDGGNGTFLGDSEWAV